MSVPFDAVTGFFDPSVEFGLKFESVSDAQEPEPAATPPATAAQPRAVPPEKTKPRGSGSEPAEISPKPAPAAKAALGKAAAKPDVEEVKPEEPTKVVSIDAFRKK